MQRIFKPVYDFPVKALFWLDDRVRQHPWVWLVLLGLVITLAAWKSLQDRDARIKRLVQEEVHRILNSRAFPRGLVGEGFLDQWNDELRESQARMEERFRAFEAEFTAEMRNALRDMMVSARTEGIPLHIQVGSTREADLLREALGGNVQVQVSRRGARPQVPPTNPRTPTPSAPSQWDRLLADEESEAPCPTNMTEPEIPTQPPPKKTRKKT